MEMGVPEVLARRGPPSGAPLPGWRPAPCLPSEELKLDSPKKKARPGGAGGEGVTGAERRGARVSRALWARKCSSLPVSRWAWGVSPVCAPVHEGVGCSRPPPGESLPNVLWSSPQEAWRGLLVTTAGLVAAILWTRAFQGLPGVSPTAQGASSNSGARWPWGLRRSGPPFPPSVDSSHPRSGVTALKWDHGGLSWPLSAWALRALDLLLVLRSAAQGAVRAEAEQGLHDQLARLRS